MSKQLKGSIAILLLTSLYGFYGIYNRMIGSTFGTFSQNYVRQLIIVVILGLVFITTNKKLKSINKKDIPWLLIWMLSGSTTMLLLFVAFNHINISTVYFLFYSTMMISGFVFGSLLFHEKLNKIKIISIVLALMGLFLIYSLSIKDNEIPYVLCSLTAGLLLGFWNTVSKKFSDNYPGIQLVFMDAFASSVVAIIGAFIVGEQMPLLNLSSGWLWIFAYALTQIFAVGLVVYGFKNLEAQIASVIMPVEVIFASIFSYFIFKEILPISTIIGGVLIASAAFLPNIKMLITSSSKIN